MFTVLTDSLDLKIDTIKKCFKTHDRLRELVHKSPAMPDGVKNTDVFPVVLRENSPPELPWKTYDHCAVLTRLYVAYDLFVWKLVAGLLAELPGLYKSYSDLPDSIRTHHRAGVAEILKNYDGDRYKDLALDIVVGGLFKGVNNDPSYTLPVELFNLERRNLTPEVLDKLFRRLGITDLWEWVAKHADMQRYIYEVLGESSSAKSELGNFVQYRNEAAHGEVDNVLAPTVIDKLADFVRTLCHVLAELVTKVIIDRILDLGRARKFGDILREFNDNYVTALILPGEVSVGQELYIFRDSCCYSVKICSIKMGDDLHQALQIANTQEVGIRLTRRAKKGSTIIQLSPQ